MKNVLVFPCGSEIGLEIYRSVNLSTHFRLYGGSSTDDHGRFVYENYIGNIPNVDEDLFIEEINRIIKEKNIDFIYPAHDSVVLKLAQAKDQGLLACDVVTSPYQTCLIARSKGKTYKALRDIISVPREYGKDEVVTDDLPLFLKPDIGQGSKGTYKATSLEDIDYQIKNDQSLLILEYLPGKEYTIDCFTNFKGELLFAQGRLRKRVSNGISVSSESVADTRFWTIAEKINKALKFDGVWFFQVKENSKGELVLLEIAPRVAGTMGLERVAGVNLALMSLYNIQKIKVDVTGELHDIIIDRALENRYKHKITYGHVYVDLDDTLIVRGKVNADLIAFLYQCINNGVKIHLITRHKFNINDTLRKYKLSNIFDEIIQFDDKSTKSSAIKSKDAIFIDDSFAERRQVYEELGIPVFDVHAVEVLKEG